MILLRSTLFNFLFFMLNFIACLICLPFLLTSRKTTFKMIRTYLRSILLLEKIVLGLDYEVRGLENLPADGSYIIAAKHQSAYETMKLHLLFEDPAIVLKQELLRIPLWGRFLARIDPIAIDRKSGKEAVAQVIDGARRVMKQNRPIVIFPQGTRVYPWQTVADRPYKIGLARMHEATGMPVVPMALNTGMFWPKHRWIKKPGKVVFEFLPPVDAKLGVYEVIRDVEQRVEQATRELQDEAIRKWPHTAYKTPD